MTEAPAARVHLDIERVAFDVALQLDEMVATAQRAELRNAAFGPALGAQGTCQASSTGSRSRSARVRSTRSPKCCA